jgi:hypothetical protein
MRAGFLRTNSAMAIRGLASPRNRPLAAPATAGQPSRDLRRDFRHWNDDEPMRRLKTMNEAASAGRPYRSATAALRFVQARLHLGRPRTGPAILSITLS